VDHVEAEGKSAQLEAANGGSVAGSEAAAGLEESLWLCPIEDRRGLDSSREGIWPNAWVCDTWSTWRVSQRDDTIVNRESRRAAGGPLPCRSMEVSAAIAHISQQFEPGRGNSILRRTKSG
jgi:hypothetical protein